MKKAIVIVFFGVLTVWWATYAYAGWQWVLYDNFDSYTTIDEMKTSPKGKWNISAADEGIANFSIDNGRLKIEHLANNPNDSAWAKLVKHPEKIMGIKATIEVESWEGDARARIGATIGTLKDNPDYYVWYAMRLRHGWSNSHSIYAPEVSGWANVLETDNDSWQYDIFSAVLNYNREEIVGVPYTLMTKFDRKIFFMKVKKPPTLGKVQYAYTEGIAKMDTPFRGIGTRTGDDAGTCVVYFDDVYVWKNIP